MSEKPHLTNIELIDGTDGAKFLRLDFSNDYHLQYIMATGADWLTVAMSLRRMAADVAHIQTLEKESLELLEK